MSRRLELDDTLKRSWLVEELDDAVSFRLADSTERTVVAKQNDERLGLMVSITSALMLRLTADDKKVMFRLGDAQFITLGQALGRHRMTRMAVRSFAWIAIIVGLLWILAAIPMEAVPDEGLDAVPLTLFKLFAGVVMLGAGIAGRFVAHRSIVLIDALWCIAAACDGAFDILHGVNSPWWGIASAALAGLALGQLRMYRLLGRLGSDARGTTSGSSG